MKTLAFFLVLAAVALLGLAGLQTNSMIQDKVPRKPGSLILLYITATVLLVAGIVIAVFQSSPAAPSEIPPNGTSQSNDGWQEQDGTLTPGWLDVDGNRYYIGDDGVMKTGWLELDGNTYYFDEDGVMATGKMEVDGVTCFFTSTGAQTLLVNPWNPVPEDYSPDLVDMDEYYGTKGLQIDSSCYGALMEMIDACNADSGSRAYVLSAYRSYETQQRLFDQKVQKLLKQNRSRADAEKEAATVVALPGTSEHHLGLAVDLIDTRRWSLDEGQENMAAQKWLMDNSWRYGFIFRYPKDKIEITGIIYEPWHYRYVGKELAEELHVTGLTLEEYIDCLS